MKKEIWRLASPQETIALFDNLLSSEERLKDCILQLTECSENLEFFFEYLWTYRSEKKAKALINHPLLPAELLLKFVYFGFGKKILQGDFLGFFAQIPELFNPESCLKVLQLKEEIGRDPSLRIHLIAALNPHNWEKYFESLAGESLSISNIISIFENLESEQVQTILFQNPILSSYLQSLMLYADRSIDDQITALEVQIVTYLEQIETWQKFVDKQKKVFDFGVEKAKTMKDRDPRRLKAIFYYILELSESNRHNHLVFLKASGVVLDDWEVQVIGDAYKNFLKNGTLF